MPAYNNHEEEVTFVQATGSSSPISYAALNLNSELSHQDQILVVRKFDESTVAGLVTTPLTNQESLSAWTLPNASTSGSSMYSLDDDTFEIDFADDNTSNAYDWTTTQSGRGSTITLPTISASDTVYIIRSTYWKSSFVSWAAGTKITSGNMNLENSQFISLLQELINRIDNPEKWDPNYGTGGGYCPLDSDGKVPNANIGAATLNISTNDGISGAGTSADPLVINRTGDSDTDSGLDINTADSPNTIKLATVDDLTTSNIIKPLSSNQGRVLKGLIDDNTALIEGLGTTVTYKGSLDVDAIAAATVTEPSGAAAGWTYDIVEADGGGTSLNIGSSGPLSSDWNTAVDGPTIAAGDVIRYDGTNWLSVTGADLRKDGTSTLTGHMDMAGDSFVMKFTTQATNHNGTEAATTAYVKQEIENTLLSELSDVAVSVNAQATFDFSAGPDSVEAMDTSTITLVDSDGTTVVFEIDDGTDGSGDGVSGSNIAIVNVTSAGVARAGQMGPGNLGTSLVYWINQQSGLDITATDGGAGEVTLVQGTGGTGGNTTITLSDATTWNSSCSVNVPSTFTGGVSGTAAVTNDMLYFDGDTWEPVALEDNYGDSEKILSTGSGLDALADVNSTVSGASNGKILKHDGDDWKLADPTTESIIGTPNSTGDASTDDEATLNATLDVSTGSVGEDNAYNAAQLGVMDFMGRRYKTTDTLDLQRDNLVLQNGRIEYTNTAATETSYAMKNDVSSLDSQTLALSDVAYYGQNYVDVTTSAIPATFYNVGDVIQIYSDGDFVSCNSGGSVDTYRSEMAVIKELLADGGGSGVTRIYLQGRLSGTYEYGNKRILSKRTAELDRTTSNVTLRNMHFKYMNGATKYFTAGDAVTGVDTETTLTLAWANHGFTSGVQVEIWDCDVSKTDGTTSIETSDGATVISQSAAYNSVNGGAVTPTVVEGSSGTFEWTLGSSYRLSQAVSSGNSNQGGPSVKVIAGLANGVRFAWAKNILIENCTFENFKNYGLIFANCYNVTIRDCTFKSSDRKAGILIRGCNNVTIDNCTFEDCYACVELDHASGNIDNVHNLKVTNCSATDCTSFINQTSDMCTNGCWVTNNDIKIKARNSTFVRFPYDGLYAIKLRGGGFHIESNRINGWEWVGDAPAYSGILSYGEGRGVDFPDDRVTHDKLLPVCLGGIYIGAQGFWGIEDATSRGFTSGMNILNNDITGVWLWGVTIEHHRNTKINDVLATKTVRGIRISGNKIHSLTRGINMDNNNTPAAGSLDFDRYEITCNMIDMPNNGVLIKKSGGTGSEAGRHVRDHGSGSGVTADVPTATTCIWLKGGGNNPAGYFYSGRISGNQMRCDENTENNTSIGIQLGHKNTKSGRIFDIHVTDNQIIKQEYAIAAYQSESSPGNMTVRRGIFTHNTYRTCTSTYNAADLADGNWADDHSSSTASWLEYSPTSNGKWNVIAQNAEAY